MFTKIINKIKGVLYRMRIIKGVELQQKVDIPVDQSFYDEIARWRCWYRGFYKEFHETWHSVQGIKRSRRLLTLGMAKQVAQEMANMICNEKMEVSCDNEAVSAFIDPILEANGFIDTTQENAEYMMAVGGMVAEVFSDRNNIKVSYVPAENFIPLSWDVNKKIDQAIIVVEQTRKKDFTYTLLRSHLKKEDGDRTIYYIVNELYRSSVNDSTLGQPVDLSIIYPGLEPYIEFPNAKRPFFAYCKPSVANNIDSDTPLGISIFANAIDTLKTIDTVFDSFQREFKLGKKRVIVPNSWLRGGVEKSADGKSRIVTKFDIDDEVFQAMEMDEKNEQFMDISPDLRTQEHISSLDALLKTLSAQTGFSANTFGFEATGLRTATEVVSENSKTFRSKQSNENNIGVFTAEVVESILWLADFLGLHSYPTEEYNVTSSFDDSIVNDKDAKINQQIALKGAGLQSRKRAIMESQGVDDTTALEILEEIAKDEQIVTAGMVDAFGVE
ncbi:phage portal protein [Listeria booriae]|uniref:phage portal protein n=1 Tax=Listeria booriae TaxID=1552123 RepID=UPI00162A219C|nr:phage portal protein [Listeria booriae]MBC2392217.1 phage portal protein [Listeria booriae]